MANAPVVGDWHGLVWADTGEHFKYVANAERVILWKWDGKRFRRVKSIPLALKEALVGIP